jgi:hypothetical protein
VSLTGSRRLGCIRGNSCEARSNPRPIAIAFCPTRPRLPLHAFCMRGEQRGRVMNLSEARCGLTPDSRTWSPPAKTRVWHRFRASQALLASRTRWKLAPDATCFPDGVLQHMRSHLRGPGTRVRLKAIHLGAIPRDPPLAQRCRIPSDWVDGLLAPPLQRLASRIPQARIWPSAGRVACRMTRTLDSTRQRATAE